MLPAISESAGDPPLDATSSTDAFVDSGSPPAEVTLAAIGALIKRARKEALGESRESFAKRLGCSVLTLDKIEDGADGVGFGNVVAALTLIGAAQPALEAISRSVDMLQLAQHPLSFPSKS